jgi:F-type H+-transporting ATPase subunit g
MAAAIKKAQALVPVIVEAAKPKLRTFWRYAKVELAPPSPGEIPSAINGAVKAVNNIQKMTFKELTVKEATLNTIIGIEVLCWFFIGECIGKGSLVGYQV